MDQRNISDEKRFLHLNGHIIERYEVRIIFILDGHYIVCDKTGRLHV